MPLISSLLSLFPSFVAGNRLIDGGDLAALVSLEFSVKTGITALAGGGQPGATPLTAALNRVDTCATNSDSVMLPQAIPGNQVSVNNNTGQTLAVFGIPLNPVTGVGDTIAAHNSNTQQPTATGVTQATTLVAIYQCYVAGQWKQVLSG
jgi:hypothetical protein